MRLISYLFPRYFEIFVVCWIGKRCNEEHDSSHEWLGHFIFVLFIRQSHPGLSWRYHAFLCHFILLMSIGCPGWILWISWCGLSLLLITFHH